MISSSAMKAIDALNEFEQTIKRMEKDRDMGLGIDYDQPYERSLEEAWIVASIMFHNTRTLQHELERMEES